VHLVPNPNVPTSETGTRHRTAERVARSIDVPVISVSEDMAVIAVYVNDEKHPLEPTARLLGRANQALQTLERYRSRLDAVAASLSALEVEDLVTLRDVVSVLQRTEMVRRIAEEIEATSSSSVSTGGSIMLQLEELLGGVYEDGRHVVRDYFHETRAGSSSRPWTCSRATAPRTCSISRPSPRCCAPRRRARPRPQRHPPWLPAAVEDPASARVGRRQHRGEHLGNLQKIMRPPSATSKRSKGSAPNRARAIKDGLARLAETSILERYS
jgi:diadenylate cyclase